MNTKGINVKRLRQSLHLSQTAFSTQMGITQPYLSEIESCKKPVTKDIMNTLINLYGRDTVEKFSIGIDKLYSENIAITDPIIEKDYMTYLLPVSAMGGSLAGFSESVELKDCEKIISPVKNSDFAITVTGDSMAPEYPSGSKLLIKRINHLAYIDWGKAYVIDTVNGIIVKEVHHCEEPGVVECVSVNPHPKYAPFKLNLSDVFGMYRIMMIIAFK